MIVTQWSGSIGIEAYLSGQLASFSALTLLVGSPIPVKTVPEMTYKVSSATLSPYSLSQTFVHCTTVRIANGADTSKKPRSRHLPCVSGNNWGVCRPISHARLAISSYDSRLD